MSLKTRFARKAVGKTAKHTARGTAAKVKRNPMRSTTLLALGGVVGLVAGLALGSRPVAE